MAPKLPTEATGPAATRAHYVNALDRVDAIPDDERGRLREVARRYAFRANDYYLGLIDWHDRDDPIRRLVVPIAEELVDADGVLDVANELATTTAHGLHHKYPDTVAVICTDVCGAYCRYCNRKRLFMPENDEPAHDLAPALAYVVAHPEINNVLLTGGDPLALSTDRLVAMLRAFHAIPHVRIIRLGSKMPAFDPARILRDTVLLATLRELSTPARRIHLIAHFDHPRELTPIAEAALAAVVEHGVVCANQTALIRGVNDDAAVLGELFNRLSYVGCPPYYVFHCVPTVGNAPYTLPLVRGLAVVRGALASGSGLARRARYVMSHERGKIEIVAADATHLYLRYLEAVDPHDVGRLVICRRDDTAQWLDDLEVVGAPL
jgi:KamA family protein